MILKWQLSNKEKAWKVIKQMNSKWVTSRELAYLAGIDTKQMANFLKVAKKLGILEYKHETIRNSAGFRTTVGYWRKIRDFDIDEVL